MGGWDGIGRQRTPYAAPRKETIMIETFLFLLGMGWLARKAVANGETKWKSLDEYDAAIAKSWGYSWKPWKK